MSLLDRLAAEIAAAGPIDVATFMTRCLHDPLDGYYATRPALGERGDFITAPLVSQMFGELIGLWLIETWRGLGAPSRFVLAEAGPGDGALMADLLRAARLDPAFLSAAELWLIETSKPLIERQRVRLADARPTPKWIAALAVLPDDAPLILIANELFDCLPVRQLVRTHAGWAERQIGLGDDGHLVFGLAPLAAGGAESDAAVGGVLEVAEAQRRLAGEIPRAGSSDRGAAP